MDLNGKTAIITGASSGIGEATAIVLAEQGVKVVVVARRKERLNKLAKKIESNGTKLIFW
jgi:NADP-dependent 3-hydroxy acid dehydrogenase YdfG